MMIIKRQTLSVKSGFRNVITSYITYEPPNMYRKLTYLTHQLPGGVRKQMQQLLQSRPRSSRPWSLAWWW